MFFSAGVGGALLADLLLAAPALGPGACPPLNQVLAWLQRCGGVLARNPG